MSSNAIPVVPGFRYAVAALALSFAPLTLAPLAAQDDSTATTPPAAEASPTPAPAPTPPAAQVPPQRFNVLVTRPRNEPSEAQVKQCVDQADAGTISGEIVVCGELGGDNSALTGDRAATQKRYAEETALKGAPRAPEAFGIPDNGKGIGFGGVPPPALFIDVEALPSAPAGSDADRIARGLPPLGQAGNLSEAEEKARREAEGITTTVPERATKKKKG